MNSKSIYFTTLIKSHIINELEYFFRNRNFDSI